MEKFAQVQSGRIELYINLNTGELFCTASSYARMTNNHRQVIYNRLDRNPHLAKNIKIEIAEKEKQLILVPADVFISWLCDDYWQKPTKSNYELIEQFSAYPGLDTSLLLEFYKALKNRKARSKTTNVTGLISEEKELQMAYFKRFGGEIEYPTASGRIDLLTDSTIYEFKEFKAWKNALGQLLAYSDCLPDRNLCAVFFAVPSSVGIKYGEECKHIRKLLKKYNITCTFLH